MKLELFDYELPEHLIAKKPAEPRDHSRLLVVHRSSQKREHRHFFDICDYLRAGDLLVLNNTRVLPARLFGTDQKGRRLEILLLERAGEPWQWQCLARPGKKIGPETPLLFPEEVRGVISRATEGRFQISFAGFGSQAAFSQWLERAGALPLPPYIKRPAEEGDRLRYQTVYAKDTGSIAAPTAGLHFTRPLLERLSRLDVEMMEITLHIGYGTFSPIRSENLDDHEMHEEDYSISPEAFEKLARAKREGRRVIPVGTTSLRALESIPTHGLNGRTRLFIRPGYRFAWADGLITNFHLPKSTLYVLVASFLGVEATRNAYTEAIRENYRFYSYGDAMVILDLTNL